MKYFFSVKEEIKRILLNRFRLKVLSKFNYDLAEDNLENALRSYLRLVEESRDFQGISCVIFSKDRPVQLDALLRSIQRFVKGVDEINVVYRASDERTSRCYKEVFSTHSSVKPFKEVSFRDDVIGVLSDIPYQRVMVLVDDIVFLREVDLGYFREVDLKQYFPSLRMGRNITYCYTFNKPVKQPVFEYHKAESEDYFHGDRYLSWSWVGADGDWSYPISFDGGIFLTSEFVALAELCSYRAPNSFEMSAQWFRKMFAGRKGLCFEVSKLVNIPFNCVQAEAKNINIGISTDYFLDQWDKGNEISIGDYVGLVPNSPHMELPLTFAERQRI